MELKAGQAVLVTTAPGARCSGNTVPLSIASFKGCNLKIGTEIFVGQYLFAGNLLGNYDWCDYTPGYIYAQIVSPVPLDHTSWTGRRAC